MPVCSASVIEVEARAQSRATIKVRSNQDYSYFRGRTFCHSCREGKAKGEEWTKAGGLPREIFESMESGSTCVRCRWSGKCYRVRDTYNYNFWVSEFILNIRRMCSHYFSNLRASGHLPLLKSLLDLHSSYVWMSLDILLVMSSLTGVILLILEILKQDLYLPFVGLGGCGLALGSCRCLQQWRGKKWKRMKSVSDAELTCLP